MRLVKETQEKNKKKHLSKERSRSEENHPEKEDEGTT